MSDQHWTEPDSECIYLPMKKQQPRRPPDDVPRLLLIKDGTGPWQVGDKFWWTEVPKRDDEPEMQGPCLGFPPYSTGPDNATGIRTMLAALDTMKERNHEALVKLINVRAPWLPQDEAERIATRLASDDLDSSDIFREGW